MVHHCKPFSTFCAHYENRTCLQFLKQTHQIIGRRDKIIQVYTREHPNVKILGIIPECSLISSSPCVIIRYSSAFVGGFFGQKSAVLPSCICSMFTKALIKMQTVEQQILWAQFKQTPYSVPHAARLG